MMMEIKTKKVLCLKENKACRFKFYRGVYKRESANLFLGHLVGELLISLGIDDQCGKDQQPISGKVKVYALLFNKQRQGYFG
jgi:hypothetical protein